jgi:hypothetical protein
MFAIDKLIHSGALLPKGRAWVVVAAFAVDIKPLCRVLEVLGEKRRLDDEERVQRGFERE